MLEQILECKETQRTMAESVQTQVRRARRTWAIDLNELRDLPVVELEEVRRPAAWADRMSPSGLYTVMPDQEDSFHVWTESRLEGTHLRLIDGDRLMKEFVTQPLAFEWILDRFATMHIPDVLVRLAGESMPLLIDCRSDGWRDLPDFRVHVALTGWVARLLGWRYELWGTVPPQLVANIQVLASYRIVDDATKEAVHALAERVGSDFRTVGGLLRAADTLRVSAAGALFHGLWSGHFEVALGSPIRTWSTIGRGEAPGEGMNLPTTFREPVA